MVVHHYQQMIKLKEDLFKGDLQVGQQKTLKDKHKKNNMLRNLKDKLRKRREKNSKKMKKIEEGMN